MGNIIKKKIIQHEYNVPHFVEKETLDKIMKRAEVLRLNCVVCSDRQIEAISTFEELRSFILDVYKVREEDSSVILCRKTNKWFGRSVKYWLTNYGDLFGFSEADIFKEIYSKKDKK